MPSKNLSAIQLLGGLRPQHFLNHYWQKKPLLIRQALPNFVPPLSKEQLFTLASSDAVESRLIRHIKNQWQLAHGPVFNCPRAKNNWTLMIQGANLHDASVDALMRRFNFIANTRLDDVMISYAVDGGGVGPHFDRYDVFLLQAAGRRRWRISQQVDLSLVDGAPLKLLRNFQGEHEYILDPGDMLYLPPHIAHEGVALGPCMTYSIGFRAPSHEELVREFLIDRAERISLRGIYADPKRKATLHPAAIDGDLLDTLASKTEALRWKQKDYVDFLGRYMTEPKAHVFFEPKAPVSLKNFKKMISKCGVKLDLKTQMLYRGKLSFINGFTLEATANVWLKRLADQRSASAAQCLQIIEHDEIIALLHEWFQAGWIT